MAIFVFRVGQEGFEGGSLTHLEQTHTAFRGKTNILVLCGMQIEDYASILHLLYKSIYNRTCLI